MGINTYLSIPIKYRPLKNRLNIVLTSNPEKYQSENKYSNLIFLNLSEKNIDKELLFDIINKIYNKDKYPFLNKDYKIILIGGKIIYEKYNHLCDIIWITKFKKDFECDLFFNYNYDKLFLEEIHYNDNELTIFKYNKNIN